MKIDLTKPNVVVVASSFDDIAEVSTIMTASPFRSRDPFDLVEIRVDSNELLGDQSQLEDAIQSLPLPKIITVRDPCEGGMSATLNAERRKKIYMRFMPFADMIDIEVQNLRLLQEVSALAIKQSKLIIGSHHNFVGTTRFESVIEIIDVARACKCSVVKFAMTALSSKDLRLMLEILEYQKAIRVSMMSMKDLGKISRLLFAKFGSVLNYGSLNEAVVSGQWPAIQLKQIIAEL